MSQKQIRTIPPALCGAALLAAGAFMGLIPGEAAAQTRQAIHIQGGTSSITVNGSLKGDQYIDYLIGAGAGQTMDIALDAHNKSTYFNVTPQDSQWAMFIGSTSGDRFTRVLPSDGNYTVRVYLMGNAARRNESSSFTIRINVNGSALRPLAASADAKIPGTPYHASAQVPCSLSGEPPKSCDAFVIRRGRDGTATVEVRLAGGNMRRVLFVKGAAVSSDATAEMKSERKDDLTTVTFDGGEAFVIPDMLVSGG